MPTFDEKVYPVKNKREIVLVQGAGRSTLRTCWAEGCTATIFANNESGVCGKCRNKRLWPCKNCDCDNKAVYGKNGALCSTCRDRVAREAKRSQAPAAPATDGFVADVRLPRPPAVPIPDRVLRNGKSANPRGFWVGCRSERLGMAHSDNHALWHTCRKRFDMPMGYVVVARVVLDYPSGWQVLGEAVDAA